MKEKIDVTCYSGYRLNEKPVKFYYKGEEYPVEKILDHSVDESMNGEHRRSRFRVSSRNKKIYSIYYDSLQDDWYLEEIKG